MNHRNRSVLTSFLSIILMQRGKWTLSIFTILLIWSLPVTASSLQFGGPHSVTVEVSPEEVWPGSTVGVTIHMSTSLDDTREVLDVRLPSGLEPILATLQCTGACSNPGVYPGTNDVTADFNVGSYDPRPQQTATLTFTASVSPDAIPGSSLNISAYLGTPDASDSIDVRILEPPHQVLSLNTSPTGIILGADGTFTIFLFPITEVLFALPELTINAALPAGLSLMPESKCINMWQGTQVSSSCEISASAAATGESEVTIVLPASSEPSAVLLSLRNTGLQSMESSTIFITMEDPSDTQVTAAPTTTVDVWGVTSLAEVGASNDDAVLNVLTTSNRPTCMAPGSSGDISLALVEQGGGPVLSVARPEPFDLAEELEPLGDRCPTLMSFEDVPPMPIYSLGIDRGPDGFNFCRFCVWVTVPEAQNGIPVVVFDPAE
jgi:hypothetical protein